MAGRAGTLNKLEQEVTEQISRLYALKKEAEELRRARQELIIGEELYERMLTQKGQELTATTRYLKRLEQSWQRRTGERTGLHLGPEEENATRADSLLEQLGDLTNPEEGE